MAAKLLEATSTDEVNEAIVAALSNELEHQTDAACLYLRQPEGLFLRTHVTGKLSAPINEELSLTAEEQQIIIKEGSQKGGGGRLPDISWVYPLVLHDQIEMLALVHSSSSAADPAPDIPSLLPLFYSVLGSAPAPQKPSDTLALEELEDLIAAISQPFVDLDESEMDHVIEQALESIGNFSQSDRAYFFILKEDGNTWCNTHEWCAPGVTSEKENLQALPTDTFPWFRQQLKSRKVIAIPQVEDLPGDASEEKEILQAQGIKSLILVPYLNRGSVTGFLGFDATRGYRRWDHGAISLLQVTAALISEAKNRTKAEAALNHLATRNEIIARVSHYFVNLQTESLRESISKTLADLGTFLNAERLVLWRQIEPSNQAYGEWTRGNKASINDTTSEVSLEDRSTEVQALKKGERFSLEDSNNFSGTEAETEFLKRFKIGAMLSVPLVRLGETVASLSVHRAEPTKWRPEDEALLQVTLATMIDAADFHEIREAHERDSRFANALIKGSGAILVVLDANANIVRFNPEAERKLHYLENEVVGKNALRLFVPPEDKETIYQSEKAIADGLVRNQVENVWLTKDGDRRRIAWVNRMLLNENGSLGHLIMSGIDVTSYRRLEKEILEIAEEERNRLGRDLHDGLGQQLAGIEFMSQALIQSMNKGQDPKTSAKQAESISELIRGSISQTRDISRALAPISLAKNGLAHALEDLAQTTTKHVGINCVFVNEGSLRVIDLGTSVNLFRIAQEAVSNAIKHGHPKIIEIALAMDYHHVELSITDDGAGMDSSDIAGDGMGVRLMYHRANMVNGDLTVESRRGTGSCITCTIRLSDSGLPVVKEETARIQIKNLF